MDTKAEVLAVFVQSEQPLKAADVATKLGIEKAAVDKAIKALKASGEIVSPKVCFYTAAK
ncbi:MAG: HTH domain-containing protein [Propionibacteriaceae bacterium]|jgi:predicted transcriptional regulator|nr:HTH domain-containing protein [Propionibacteriaceae bacterium]